MKKLLFALALAAAAASGYYLDVLTAVPPICPTSATIKPNAAPSPAAPSARLEYSPKEIYSCWWGAWSQNEAHCGTITT